MKTLDYLQMMIYKFAETKYNHVKTQGWSPCDLPIHAFSMCNDVFLNPFSIILCFSIYLD